VPAGIIGTIPDVGVVILGIADTGDLNGLDAAMGILAASPTVELAVEDVVLGPTTISVPSAATDPGGSPWIWNLPPSNGAGLDGNWGLEAVRVPSMWNLNDHASRQGGHPLTAVLDAGFDDTNSDGANDHPQGDLPGLRTYIYDWTTAQFVPGGTTNTHGQHVAGIIGARFGDGIGVEGVNPFVAGKGSTPDLFIGISIRSPFIVPRGRTRSRRRRGSSSGGSLPRRPRH